MKEKWIRSYLETAKIFANLSEAKRLKVGAICVDSTGSRVISIGYNGQPPNWDNCCEDENGSTLPTVIHAEANCISKLAKSNGGGENSYLFITHSPCIECAKLILQAGIKTVYYIYKYRSEEGIQFLERCGIQVTNYNL